MRAGPCEGPAFFYTPACGPAHPKTMTQTQLNDLIASGELRDLEILGEELTNLDFRGCLLEGVRFEECTLVGCNFDNCTLARVSLRKSHLQNCRFRRARISWSDFRYCEIEKATFEEARIDFCDFYRALLGGVVIMRKSRISNTSLYYTYLCEGVNIRRENLVDDRLLQEDKEAYRRFLVEWNTYGTGVRTNDQKIVSEWNPEASLRARWADAEDIYKNLNGLWAGIGFMRDSNWAYVKGRRMERRRMCIEWCDGPAKRRFALTWHIAANALSDLMFGFGESILRMIATYIILVLFFAFIFFGNASLPSYLEALWISLKNMAGVGSEELTGISPFMDMLNVLQTTMGILLTGIFGFILGNKIRNQ